MYTKEEREKFIFQYLEKHLGTDVLDSQFHDLYVEKFPCYTREFKMIGSRPVPQAMRDLVRLYNEGRLKRNPIGLGGMGMGFPKWIYTYFLPQSK